MTYEEKRKQFGSDDAMARAMFDLAVAFQIEATRLEHLLDLSQALRQRAETKLYHRQHPIKKTNYTLEPQ